MRTADMRIALTDAQERLRAELRGYFAELVTPERRAALAGSTSDFGSRDGAAEFGDAAVYKEVIREIGNDGWLGSAGPRSTAARTARWSSSRSSSTPCRRRRSDPFLTLTPSDRRSCGSAPTAEAGILPKILSGELHFSIGYSEPESGTDLASLRTRARLEGDD